MANYELGSLIWRIKGETADFDKKVTASNQRINKFADGAKAAGKKLTTFVTAPLVGLGVAAVKSASDLEESLNAVNVVFGDSADTIEQWGQSASENAGLSQSSFNELATVIGAQLKQSGQSIDDVADNTIELTQRAADLASVFNTDVKDATNALGAALRGENEPARRFGINISQAAIESEALASGLVKSKDQIDEQVKVQARYNLILKQSSDVAGDFANTSDSLANQTRILKSDLTDVAAELGENLIPVAEDLIGVASDLVGWFGDLDDEGQRLVVTLGGIAAGIGPVLIGVGSLTKAIQTLSTSALFSPVGLIAAAAAATVGLLEFAMAEKRATDAAGTTAQVLKDADSTFDSFSRVAKESNVNLNAGADAAEVAGQRYAAMAESINSAATVTGALSEKALLAAERNERALTAVENNLEVERERTQQIKEAELAEQARLEGVIEARRTATEGYREEIDLINRKAELDLLTAEEVAEAKLQAEEDFQEQLLSIGYDGLENEAERLDIGDRQLLDSIERRKELYRSLEDENEDVQLNITNTQLQALRARSAALNNYSNKEKSDLDERRKKYEDVAEKYVLNFTSAFEDVGAALVNQEDAWAAVGQAALGTIAEVVRALGQLLAAKAAQLYADAFFSAGTSLPFAIAATAGSAAAFAAAGAIEASAQNFQEGGFVQPRPGTPDTGDRVPARLNPREVVLTESDATELLNFIRSPKKQGITINQYNTLNTDSEKNMQRAARQLYPYLDREGARRG